jgi:hypothetical protein
MGQNSVPFAVLRSLPAPTGQNIVKTAQGKYINGKKEKAI